MSGLYNTGIRDYCGNENSLKKLSSHFSKDFTFQQEGIKDSYNQDVINPITTFHLNDLLQDVITNDKSKAPLSIQETNAVVDLDLDSVPNTDKTFKNNLNFTPSYQPPAFYYQMPNINFAYNVPKNSFIPPDQSVVARQWAESELSKFDDKIINPEDLEVMSTNEKQASNPRFLDVLQDLAANEELNEIDFTNEEVNNANSSFLYDLDGDLRNMREKIDSNVDNVEVWNQIEKSLYQNVPDMIFSASNLYLTEVRSIENPEDLSKKIEEILVKGIQLYKQGQFSEAILAFEAVVQSDPQNESGWSYLGMSLSENEQDHRAIVACNKCLELNKKNRDVLLSLARIHCNELTLSSTISCLEKWLLANPKYSDLATIGQETMHDTQDGGDMSMLDDMYELAFESSGKFAIIDEQFNLALNRNEFDIDPELEIAAGTLYHSVQDYNRATTRFEAAVNVIKDNACLWNKLGTAHCNAGNYEKAVNAYRKALEFGPGFARAQCNLGVTYYNMELYKEAIQHAIKAYQIQHVENTNRLNEKYDRVIESDPIWTLIRRSAFKLDRQDLDLVIFSRDIEALSKEFDV